MVNAGAAPGGEGWIESAGWLSRARRLGPLRYSDLGRRRLSPPEEGVVAPLSVWLSDWLDENWRDAGRPDPFTAVVVSGDHGALVSQVLGRPPECRGALRYVVVDPDATGSEPPPDLAAVVQLEDPAFLYPAAPVAPGATGAMADEEDPESRPPARGIGPLVTFLTEVPALGEGEGAVVALEVLSRLPFELFEAGDDGWYEVRLAAEGERMIEITAPASDDGPIHPTGGPADDPGRRWRRQTGAVGWMRRVLPTIAAGAVAVVDRWDGPDGLDAEQLRQVRPPVEPEPVPVDGTGWSVLTWRCLG